MARATTLFWWHLTITTASLCCECDVAVWCLAADWDNQSMPLVETTRLLLDYVGLIEFQQ